MKTLPFSSSTLFASEKAVKEERSLSIPFDKLRDRQQRWNFFLPYNGFMYSEQKRNLPFSNCQGQP